jgi:hypothetical protein
MKKYCAYLLLLFITGSVYAQDEAAVPFLEFQQSPLLFSAGWIGTAIPNANADGFYLNPAQLGNFSRVNNFSLFFMPQKTDWGPNYSYSAGTTFNSFSAALGYNLKRNDDDLPLLALDISTISLITNKSTLHHQPIPKDMELKKQQIILIVSALVQVTSIILFSIWVFH